MVNKDFQTFSKKERQNIESFVKIKLQRNIKNGFSNIRRALSTRRKKRKVNK